MGRQQLLVFCSAYSITISAPTHSEGFMLSRSGFFGCFEHMWVDVQYSFILYSPRLHAKVHSCFDEKHTA